jgi:hypothetical protein
MVIIDASVKGVQLEAQFLQDGIGDIGGTRVGRRRDV